MPVPIVTGAARLPSYKRVYVKVGWRDNWIFVPRIKPKQIIRSVSPQVGEADLTVFFGNVQPVGMPFDFYDAFALNGYYVLITSVKLMWGAEGPPAPNPANENIDFVGVIEDTETQPRSSTQLCGIQRIKAYSLERLLEREIIEKAWAVNDSAPDAFSIDFAPPFNSRNPFQQKHEQQLDVDTRRLLGNATADGKYFGHQSEWNGKTAIEYLLKNIAPKPIPWNWDTSKGQHESLTQLIDIWPQQGLSVKAVIDSIVSRRRGYTWYLETDGRNYANVRVSSMFGSAFMVGDAVIPANNRQVSYSIPPTIPERHIFGVPSFRYTDLNRVDRVVVQAQCIKLAGTIAYNDGTLFIGWTPDHENEYRNLFPNEPRRADTARQAPKYERVFTHYILRRYGLAHWNGMLGRGATGANMMNAIPTANDDGTVSWFPTGQRLWVPAIRFEPLLPFKSGIDYSLAEGEGDFNPPDADPEYIEPLVWLQDPLDAKFMLAKMMQLKQPYFHQANVTVSTKEAGLKVHCSPAHHIADASHSPVIPAARRGVKFPNTMYNSQVNYKTMVATVFFVLDVRPRIVIQAPVQSERKVTMYVTVKSAEYWYAMPNCVVDTAADGTLKTIHADFAYPNPLRYDNYKLEMVATTVREWYAVERQAIKLNINDYGYGETITCELGVYLNDITGLAIQKPVNSVVTRLVFDCERDTSVIETAFVTLEERLDLTEFMAELDNIEVTLQGNQR